MQSEPSPRRRQDGSREAPCAPPTPSAPSMPQAAGHVARIAPAPSTMGICRRHAEPCPLVRHEERTAEAASFGEGAWFLYSGDAGDVASGTCSQLPRVMDTLRAGLSTRSSGRACLPGLGCLLLCS
eukprot:jgi/Tetstr1/426120/TSEL_016448.t1